MFFGFRIINLLTLNTVVLAPCLDVLDYYFSSYLSSFSLLIFSSYCQCAKRQTFLFDIL